ncbi:MAG: Fic family protein [Bacteroidales bacterium]|nr:Fic family protein [Clostridium sp.]MCM1204970.1 Fic family protein [Bacteroidales bacterium]
MADNKYCYPDTEILINKLNIKNKENLFQAEKKLTFIRIQELQQHPIAGNFDFPHLRKIHKYIFQDIYNWAGEIRTVEIGKGNLFCTTSCIQSYGESVFNKYYSQCEQYKNNRAEFIKVLAENYADLNALHPFREGNGRAQREFARLVCLSCDYRFDLSCTTHKKMLQASQLSFDMADCSLLCDIFKEAVIPLSDYIESSTHLKILTSDDLKIGASDEQYYDYYASSEIDDIEKYNSFYKEKIQNNYQKTVSPNAPSTEKQPSKSTERKSTIADRIAQKKALISQKKSEKRSRERHKPNEHDL